MTFSASSVISRSLGVTTRNFLTLFVLSLIVMGPIAVVSYFLTPDAANLEKALADVQVGRVGVASDALAKQSSPGRQFLVSMLQMVGQAVVAGAVSFVVFQSLRGGKTSIGASVQKGFSRLFPIIGVSIVYALGVGIGLVLLIVPGIIIACMWYVAVPATVLENLGVGAALSRSGALTKGYRGSIFALFLMIFLMMLVVMLVLAGMFAALGAAVGGVLSLVIGVFIALFSGTLSAVCYHDLRMVKDGVSTEDMAKVFD